MKSDWVFKTKPFDHQLKGFIESRDKEAYALLWEMGCGKTHTLINTAGWLYATGKINGVLIIAPNGLTRTWCDQFEEHCPDYINHKSAYYSSTPTKKEQENLIKLFDHNGLIVASINIEALATPKGVDFCKRFVNNYDTIMIIDESTSIKNPKAIRTKNILKLAPLAKYRRIANGTPVTNSPMDIYCQFKFLDEHILRTSSYYSFRNRYAIMKEMRTAGRSFMNIVGYTNLDELTDYIKPYSSRILKKECLDLPEKLYSKRYVQLSPSQKTLYNSLKKDIVAEFNGMAMSAPLALTKLLRLQQIVGGFFVPDDIIAANDGMDHVEYYEPQPIDKVNPRIESLIELLEETNGKVIIWARFRAEIEAICNGIYKSFGTTTIAVEYHGGIDNGTRANNIQRFQSDSECRFFVGHVQAGGKGLTLHSATTVVYYSNDFSLENRLQSEDRCHRIGQKHNVTYVDMIAEGTLDEKIVETLRNKKSVADLITGDEPLNNWV